MPSDPGSDETIFAAALQWETPEQRALYLDEACAGDAGLRRRVEELLHASADAKTFLERPVGRPRRSADHGDARPTVKLSFSALEPVAEGPGTRIGRYKLLQQIGEGGCGTVFMAEQEEPVRRRVALKVIKLGMDTRSVVARFEAERQALAMMDHPNIAKVLDAGATGSGRPFFVMELVRGIPITRYCDENKLDTQRRLDLFIKVCQAIQHAHQKGIIHRDIKPSNILVTLHDGVPVPKVIDFGIAKATEGRLTDATLFTAFEQFIGTPAYMSPEQAEMTSLDIDTRADIYALGVLLYELLTGKTPFDGRELAQAGLDAMRKTIREVEPQRPSTRLSTLQGAILTTTAQAHGTDSLRLVDLIRGDLDWIVMKCLEKDRTRRYDTANGLAADLKRHLDNEPVVARPPTAAYKFQKAFRRNRLVFSAAGLVLTALAAGVAVSLWQAVRADREARRAIQAEASAELRLAESEAISKFMTEVFQSPDPARDGRTITVAETLGAAAKKLDTGLADQPARRAALQATLGKTYCSLGLNREAADVMEKSLGYYVSTVGRDHTNTMGVIRYLAGSYDITGRSEEALRLREELLRFHRRTSGPEHPDTVLAMMLVGNSYLTLGRLDDELKLEEAVLPLARKVFGPGHARTLDAMNNLAGTYSDVGRTNEALAMLRSCVRDAARYLGPDSETTLGTMDNLGMEEAKSGSLEEAIRLCRLSMESFRRVFGPEHYRALNAMSNLATAYRLARRFDEAIALEEEALPIKRRRLGAGHRFILESLQNLATCYEQVGRQPEAEALRREHADLKAKAGASAASGPSPALAPSRP